MRKRDGFVLMGFRIDPKMKSRLIARAHELNMKHSDFIRMAIAEKLGVQPIISLTADQLGAFADQIGKRVVAQGKKRRKIA